jgi:tRNA pseudouridine55 synthase
VAEPFGFLFIDKPRGMTSHDVVAAVRRGTKIKRIGHTGTLDPMATGVLILCIGAATRLSEYVMPAAKMYSATVRLGVETDSYDADGTVIATTDASHITQADVERALTAFQGEVLQIPPMVSAIKKEGKKLYELARQGVEIEREPRRVTLYTKLTRFDSPELDLVITCTAGTYIRSIAHDLGEMLGVGAHLTALRRTHNGVNTTDLIPWAVLQEAIRNGTWQTYLRNESYVLPDMCRVDFDETETDHLLHGRTAPVMKPLYDPCDDPEKPLALAYDNRTDRFIGIVERRGDNWHPVKIFLPQD